MVAMIEKICPTCNKTFLVRACVADVRRCCSWPCQNAWKRSHRVVLNCQNCNKSFTMSRYYSKSGRKYCSRACWNIIFGKMMTGNKHKEGKSPWNKGTKGAMPPAWNKGKSNPAIQGKKNVNWKGQEASYGSVHAWLRRHLGKPDTCENCGTSGLSGRKIHWANISRKYYRKFDDWIRLCAKCHKAYDTDKLTLAQIGG